MITRPEWPSFGNFIERGFTAIPEDFQMEGKRIGSLNHHFMCDISNWFISDVSGLHYNPDGRNIRVFSFEPSFIEKLDFAEGCYDSVFGKISVRWERKGNYIIAQAAYPKEIKCSFASPRGFEIISQRETEESSIFELSRKKPL